MSGTNIVAVNADVQSVIDEITEAKREVDSFSLIEKVDPDSLAAKKLSALKIAAAKELDGELARVAKVAPGPTQQKAAGQSRRHCWRIVGRYGELVDTINRQPFNIIPTMDADGTWIDFKIRVREVPIPEAAGKLKAEIDVALTTIKSVMQDRKANLGYFGYLDNFKNWDSANREYIEQLLGIAQVGLMTSEPSRVEFARSDLQRLKQLFVLREGGIVKNTYISHLFIWSGICTSVFILLYVFVRDHGVHMGSDPAWWGQLLYATRNFNLLAAGTAAGTWLSFSLRRQELAFEDLAVLEPDRLVPAVRVIYMVGLATVVGLLLFSGAVVAGIGNVTGDKGMQDHGTWALLLGLLSGIAERALGTAVGRRGADFASALGGSAAASKAKP